MIQLHDVRNSHGGRQQFCRLIALAQVHVKDAYRGLERFLKKRLDRSARLRRSLRKRTKAYRVAAFRQRAPFRSPLQNGARWRNAATRYALVLLRSDLRSLAERSSLFFRKRSSPRYASLT